MGKHQKQHKKRQAVSEAASKAKKKQKQQQEECANETDVEIQSLSFGDAFSAGLAFEQLEALDGALSAFQRAVQCQPTHVGALAHLADVCAADEQQEQALKWYTQASEQVDGRTDASIWFRRGLSHAALEQPLEAVAAYREALQISAKELQAAKDGEEGVEELQKAYGVTLAAMAEAFAELGDLDAAVKVFEDATERFPENANLQYNLANMCRARSGGQGSDAFDVQVLKCLERAVELSPDTREFVDDLVEYLELHEKHPERVRELKEKAESLQAEEKAVQSDSEHKEEDESSEEEGDNDDDDEEEDNDDGDEEEYNDDDEEEEHDEEKVPMTTRSE